MATVIEAPVEEMANEPEANKLFRMVMRFKGSDLHLKVNTAPAMRLAGVLRLMQLPPLSSSDMERLMFPLLSIPVFIVCAIMGLRRSPQWAEPAIDEADDDQVA